MAGTVVTPEKVATRVAYGETLVKLGREHADVVVLDADLACSTMTEKFAKEFPERFFNMGIAEQNLIDVGCGFALAGKVPFVSTFAMFAVGKAWEQVRNSAGHMLANLKICATHAGISLGEDAATHQILEDLATTRVIPGMTVLVPSDGPETEAIIRAAYAYHGPVYVRLGRPALPVIPRETPLNFQIGKAEWLREGTDATIIACGLMVNQARLAALELEAEGLSVGVLNMSSIKPIDREAIVKAARMSGAIVTAEEHNVIGGLGSAVAEVLGEELPTPMVRVGTQDTYGESGTLDALLTKYGLMPSDLSQAVRQVLSKKPRA